MRDGNPLSGKIQILSISSDDDQFHPASLQAQSLDQGAEASFEVSTVQYHSSRTHVMEDEYSTIEIMVILVWFVSMRRWSVQ